MPGSDKLPGIFYLCLKYRHLPDEPYGYAVGGVVFLSQYFGTGGEVVRTSYIGKEKMQICFHRIIFYSGKIAPGNTVIAFSDIFCAFSYRSGLVHPFYEYIPFG